ncbi:MAG: hypothetical protein PW788_00770 [Micavibrio sp.]|nr:hypothetical protein [Micavibrio sp.]
MKKPKKQFAVKPSLYAACVELAKGNTAAGGLLCQIALMTEHGSLKDEKDVEGWLALSSAQWKVLTGFSRHQHDNALKSLKSKNLVEFRRRKLSRRDKSALSWVRLPWATKSGISDIMQREPISAFAETVVIYKSDIAELAEATISDDADILDKNVIIENEDIFENVIIEETKIKSASQNSKQKELSKRKMFKKLMAEIYQECPHIPADPYTTTSGEVLTLAVEYIQSNPANFLSDCPEGKGGYPYVLGKIFQEWDAFCVFVEYMCNGYNLPKVAQLWSLKHHLKAIPDFLNFLNMRRKFELELVNSGLLDPKDYSLWCSNMAEFIHYRKLSSDEKFKFLKAKVDDAFKKWTAQQEQEKKWEAVMAKKK